MSNNVSLADKLSQKLDAGEITQQEYDDLLKKFSDLDLLSASVRSKSHQQKGNKWRVTGKRILDGDEIDGPVRVSGSLTVNGDLKCSTMKISGATVVDGNLTVVEETKVSGSLKVNGDGKFGNTVKISGKLTTENGLFLSEGLKISGKASSGDQILAGGPIVISGKLQGKNVQSKSSVSVSGAVLLEEDLVAESFSSSGGPSVIKGNLLAKEVEIAKRYRERYEGESVDNSVEDGDDDETSEDPMLDSIAGIGKFVSGLVNKLVPSIMGSFGKNGGGPPKIFNVEGNIEGEEIDISYTAILGDVKGDNVIIGPEVTVTGTIFYTNELVVPETSEFKSQKV